MLVVVAPDPRKETLISLMCGSSNLMEWASLSLKQTIGGA